jgi:hypothetical protein
MSDLLCVLVPSGPPMGGGVDQVAGSVSQTSTRCRDQGNAGQTDRRLSGPCMPLGAG